MDARLYMCRVYFPKHSEFNKKFRPVKYVALLHAYHSSFLAACEAAKAVAVARRYLSGLLEVSVSQLTPARCLKKGELEIICFKLSGTFLLPLHNKYSQAANTCKTFEKLSI